MSNDPQMSTGDWLGLGSLAAMVVGSVVGGVKGMLGKRDGRLTALEQGHNDQVTQLAVLKTSQESLHFRLDDIKEEIKASAQRGAERVDGTLAQVLDAIRRERDKPQH